MTAPRRARHFKDPTRASQNQDEMELLVLTFADDQIRAITRFDNRTLQEPRNARGG
jgi:hypothetical protein